MKINNKIDLKIKYAEYCPNCYSESIEKIDKNGKISYRCLSCGRKSDRLIIVDQKINFWVDKEKNYWHESAGTFVFNERGEILLLNRNKFPFAYTVPAGHVERGENSQMAALREIREEVGLKLKNLELVTEEDLTKDPCRRGADHHRWHLYKAQINNDKILVNDESSNFVWKKPQDTLNLKLTVPVRYFLNKFF